MSDEFGGSTFFGGRSGTPGRTERKEGSARGGSEETSGFPVVDGTDVEEGIERDFGEESAEEDEDDFVGEFEGVEQRTEANKDKNRSPTQGDLEDVGDGE